MQDVFSGEHFDLTVVLLVTVVGHAQIVTVAAQQLPAVVGSGAERGTQPFHPGRCRDKTCGLEADVKGGRRSVVEPDFSRLGMYLLGPGAVIRLCLTA